MKTWTQFKVSTLLFAIILAAIVASIIIANIQFDRVTEQESLASDISSCVDDLSYLYNDYLLTQENQLLDLWQYKFTSLSSDVDSLRAYTPEQKALVKNIRTNTVRLKSIFLSVSPVLADNYSDNLSIVANMNLFRDSWRRIMARRLVIASNTAHLTQLLDSQADAIKQANTITIMALVGVFAVYIAASYLIMRLHTRYRATGEGTNHKNRQPRLSK